jgi:pilus assembly protein CpaC
MNRIQISSSLLWAKVIAVSIGLSSGAAVCQAQSVRAAAAVAVTPLTLSTSAQEDALHITVGRSVLLNSSTSLRRVYVGNPAVLQTYTSGTDQVVLTAKQPGESTLVVWDEAGAHRMYSVFADLNPDGLRRSLEQTFPGLDLHAETGEEKIVLTGSVDSAATADAAVKLASQYGKDIVNSIQIAPVHGKQVELKLRIVEVDRSKADQFGINIFSGGRTAIATSTGQFGGAAVGSGSTLSVSDALNLFLYNAKLDVGATIRDLEQKQVLQVLAEPTLSTMSGVPARFLSGGEFPFPVVQSGTGNSSAITIQFRPYGVRVDFTPTVNPDGTIHLKLAPEVSTLDYSNSVSVSGFTIPALSTRRAETDVEIRDGQSFVVSGLLDHRTTEILSKMPGIGDVPLLGQFFRSKNLSHSVLELVVIVTATVIDPLKAGAPEEAKEPAFVVPSLDAQKFDQKVPGSFASGQSAATADEPEARKQ